jgi:hypothetical protein
MSGAMAYVRERYSVPAKRGARVRFCGDECVIVGARDGLLRLRCVSTGDLWTAHPTWRMEYEARRVETEGSNDSEASA